MISNLSFYNNTTLGAFMISVKLKIVPFFVCQENKLNILVAMGAFCRCLINSIFKTFFYFMNSFFELYKVFKKKFQADLIFSIMLSSFTFFIRFFQGSLAPHLRRVKYELG